MSLRLFSFADIHYNTAYFNSIISFINDAVEQNKCDLVMCAGDLCSSSSDADLSDLSDLRNNYFERLNAPYYIVPGNHDVKSSVCENGCSDHVGTPASCNYRTVFGDPSWLTTFTKDEITYQLIGVSICPDDIESYYWIFDFNQSGISKTLPTILLNHGPIVIPSDTSCGSWSTNTYLYSINQNLINQMDKLNVLVSYTGHVHAPGQTIKNNRLYISENTCSNSNARCTVDSTRFIGYSKITLNNGVFTVQYQTLRFRYEDGTTPVFVDPFICIPNWQCETPLNGYEYDGCGNRRLKSACSSISPSGNNATAILVGIAAMIAAYFALKK